MSQRSTRACWMLMCDTSLNRPWFLSIYARSSKHWFSSISNVREIFKDTKRFTNSPVRTVMETTIVASRFSTTRSLTWRGLPSGIQKIVVMKCSPWSEIGVHLQRISAFKCDLLSPGRLRVISVGFIHVVIEL